MRHEYAAIGRYGRAVAADIAGRFGRDRFVQFVQDTAGEGSEKAIICPADFRPNMPCTPGVQVRDTVYCAGQTRSDLKTRESPESFAQEVRQTFRRIRITLDAGGYEFSDVVDAKAYLTDSSLVGEMNSGNTQYFKRDRPARTTVGVASLVGSARVEITVIARRPVE